MKIGIVCPYNIYKGGGVQECVKAMYAELIRRGHDVKILTPLPREISDVHPQGVLFIGGAADFKSPFHTTAQISVNVNGDAVEELLAREQFDVLHFHEPWVPVVSRQILGRSTSKNVATFHAKLPDTVMSKTIERVITPYTKSILKYLHGLTAVSEAAASYVRTLTDTPISLIPNGIDLERYKNAPNIGSTGDKHIVFVGRLERRKGLKYLLKAYAALTQIHPSVKLSIAGDGPARQKLELLASNLGLNNVEFLGYVNDADKINLLRKADLLCSPALFGESFGIVLLEAMATGVPIIAGDNPGYAGVMSGRGQLSLVDPKNTAEFVRRLDLLLHDQPLRKLLIDWGSNHVNQFSYPKVIDKYEKLYRDVAGGV